MNQAYPLETDLWRAQLGEAAGSRLLVTVTYQSDGGWVTIKGKFAGVHTGADLLAIDCLGSAGHAKRAPQPGQEIGVSYRRGSRKCVFTSCLVDQSTRATADGGTRSQLRITWPDGVQELQRRLYHRTVVPQNRLIPVELWLSQGQEGDAAGSSAQRGKMVDLSAGGVSVELPREARPRWREDEQLACRFSPGPDRQPIEVSAKLTHYTRLANGHVRVGLQFLGLDAGDRGRHALQKISRMTHWLRA